jgi:hypothetical protein
MSLKPYLQNMSHVTNGIRTFAMTAGTESPEWAFACEWDPHWYAGVDERFGFLSGEAGLRPSRRTRCRVH